MEIFCSQCGKEIHKPPENVWWTWDDESTEETYLCDDCFNKLGLNFEDEGVEGGSLAVEST